MSDEGGAPRADVSSLTTPPEDVFAVDANQVYALAPDGIDSQPLSGGDVHRLAAAIAPYCVGSDVVIARVPK